MWLSVWPLEATVQLSNSCSIYSQWNDNIPEMKTWLFFSFSFFKWPLISENVINLDMWLAFILFFSMFALCCCFPFPQLRGGEETRSTTGSSPSPRSSQTAISTAPRPEQWGAFYLTPNSCSRFLSWCSALSKPACLELACFLWPVVTLVAAFFQKLLKLTCRTLRLHHKELFTCLFKVRWSSVPRTGESVLVAIVVNTLSRYLRRWVPATTATAGRLFIQSPTRIGTLPVYR